MQQTAFNRDTTRVHFRNAAARAKFESGKMTAAEARNAVVEVPVRRGIDRKQMKTLMNDMKYAAKLNDPEWQRKAAEIREAKNKGRAGHE